MPGAGCAIPVDSGVIVDVTLIGAPRVVVTAAQRARPAFGALKGAAVRRASEPSRPS